MSHFKSIIPKYSNLMVEPPSAWVLAIDNKRWWPPGLGSFALDGIPP